MSTALIKGLIAAGGLGLGGIGIWKLTEYMTPKTLGQKLVREGYEFHPFGDDQQLDGWKDLAKKYRDNTETNDKFSNLTISTGTPGDTDAKNLRGECKKLYEKEISEDGQMTDLTKLKKWCVVSGPNTTAPKQQ